MRLTLTLAVVVVSLFWPVARALPPAAAIESAAAITAPAQPASGPGGSQYSHASVEEHTYGEGDLQYWLFEPAGPKPDSAPVVIFNHGWGAMTPGGYRAWIDHIVRRGNIVIYPRYQASFTTKPGTFSNNAIAASKDALQRLKSESGHVRPQLDKLAVVGHSAGGNISAGVAARAASEGLPPIKAVMCVQPGKTWGPRMVQIPLDDVSTMPASTLLLTLVGDRDTIAKDIDAKRIINQTVQVPAENKNFVKIVSDNHGSPALIANHFCPAAPAAGSDGDLGTKMSGTTQKGGQLRQLIKERMRQRLQQYANQNKDEGGNETGAGPSLKVTEIPAAETNLDDRQNQTQPPSTDDSSSRQEQSASPVLDSQHMKGINALDYYCTWKLFDALEDAAFYGKNRDYALGNTPNQRYMGKWSDGVPVKELVVQIGQAR